MDDFYINDKCDRCHGSLVGGRIMSMFNEECICMVCKQKEVARPDYAEAVKKDIKEHTDKQTFICGICGKVSKGYGNNPFPLMYAKKCCDECNIRVVIPARLNSKKRLAEFARKLSDD